jgi:hypothetical protein
MAPARRTSAAPPLFTRIVRIAGSFIDPPHTAPRRRIEPDQGGRACNRESRGSQEARMKDARSPSDRHLVLATHADVTRILGDMDDATAAEILGLRPTIALLDAAAMSITGDEDVALRPNQPGADVVARIVEILAIADQEDEPPPAR